MSTLADVLDEFLDRVPEERLVDLFHGTNIAIRTISKRLYFHESDLIRGELSVPFFAEVDFSAAPGSIQFTAGTSEALPTIVNTHNDYPATFLPGMRITTNVGSNTGPFTITQMAAGLLTLSANDTVVGTPPGLPGVTISSDAAHGVLPSDFWGLLSKPWVVGYRWPLLSLPNIETRLVYPGAGVPRYYEIAGSSLMLLVPRVATNLTVSGLYFQKPVSIEDMYDELPWNGLFDDALQEYIIQGLTSGNILSDQMYGAMKRMMTDAVDLVVQKRPKKGPIPMPRGTDYEALWGNIGPATWRW